MPQLPRTEAEIVVLGKNVLEGFSENPDVFADPPLPCDDLDALLQQYGAISSTVCQAKSALQTAFKQKKAVLAELKCQVQRSVHWAMNHTDNDRVKLSLINWEPPKGRGRLLPPVSPSALEWTITQTGWVVLNWQPGRSKSAGKTRSYVVRRRLANQGKNNPWQEVGIFLQSSAVLPNEPKGIKLAYQVYAQNTAGSSMPTGSAILTV